MESTLMTTDNSAPESEMLSAPAGVVSSVQSEHLSQDELSFQALFGMLGVGVAQADVENGQFRRANAKLCSLLGYSQEELLKMTFSQVTHPEDRDRDLAEFRRALSGERDTYTIEKRLIRKDGEVVWGLLNITIVRNADGTPLHGMAITQDITEHKAREKKLLEQDERLQKEFALIESVYACAPVGLAFNDTEGRFVRVNARMAEINGLPIEAHLGRCAEEVIPEIAPVILPLQREVMRTGKPFIGMEMSAATPSTLGEVRDWRVSFHPVHNSAGAVLGISVVVEDVTERKRAEIALKTQEEILRQIGDNLPDSAIYQVLAFPDGKRRFVYVSAGIEKLTGVSVEEALRNASSLYNLVHPEDVPRIVEAEERCIRESCVYDIVVRSRHRGTGEWRWAHLRSAPRRLEDGSTVWDGCYTDITRHEEARQALRVAHARLEGFFQANIVGVVIANTRGSVLESNDYFLSLIGYTREELERGEVRWDRATPEEHLPASYQAIKEIRESGTSRVYEKEFVHRNGNRVAVLVACALLPGEDEQVAAFVLDVTERKKAEQALRDADRRKNEFLAMLGHELRNPLAAIRNALVVCEQSQADPESFDWARGVINRQSAQLSRLVDDLLDVSRITRGKVELRKQHIEVPPVLDHAVEAVRPLLSERGHELITAFDPGEQLVVEADPTRLEQIVINLLANAARYTPPGGKIWLEARGNSSEIIITVRDTGIGIRPDRIGEMFELFAQGERSLARSEGGLGLGLTIVRTLVEMHGGQVNAFSEGEGCGSKFTVHLPAMVRPQILPPAVKQVTDGLHRSLPILVVDDNQDAAQGIARLLQRRGHTVKTTHDGFTALEIARVFLPKIILLDLGLPGMDGFEVAAALRSEQFREHAFTIIAVSGYGQEEDRIRTREAGFDHHLVKPVDFEFLNRILTDSHV